MEFFIDLAGRARQIGKRNIATAVAEVGYVHMQAIDRGPDPIRSTADRTVIVAFKPQLLSRLTLAALGYKLADLEPTRIVVLEETNPPKCRVFENGMLAMRCIAAAANVEPAASVDDEPAPTQVSVRNDRIL